MCRNMFVTVGGGQGVAILDFLASRAAVNSDSFLTRGGVMQDDEKVADWLRKAVEHTGTRIKSLMDCSKAAQAALWGCLGPIAHQLSELTHEASCPGDNEERSSRVYFCPVY